MKTSRRSLFGMEAFAKRDRDMKIDFPAMLQTLGRHDAELKEQHRSISHISQGEDYANIWSPNSFMHTALGLRRGWVGGYSPLAEINRLQHLVALQKNWLSDKTIALVVKSYEEKFGPLNLH